MELQSILVGVFMYHRLLADELAGIVKHFPVVLLTGPRQVGKTTLLRTFGADKYAWVTLDDLAAREEAIADPELFLHNHPPPVIIDEIQYAPDLLSYIKIYVDTHPAQTGSFLLTGSQKFALMRGIKESLAGRVAVLDLLGLSLPEISGVLQPKAFLPDEEWLVSHSQDPREPMSVERLYEHIFNGSLPGLLSRSLEYRELFMSSYLETYISRDVRDFFSIPDMLSFRKFIVATAARTAQMLNYADLARDCGIDPKTAKRWLGILEMSGLVCLLPAYSRNVTSRVIKAPKLYFLDTGLCAWLCGYDSVSVLEKGPMSGALLETWVFAEILKSWWNKAKTAGIYYYRDKDQKEVDFIIERQGRLFPVAVKKTMRPMMNAAKNFAALEKLGVSVAPAVILSLKPDFSMLDRNTHLVPIWEI